ncbi:ankyrin repeat domain-containing protein [bacterium]|nr:ankyrin repeat domain-containing protein [bacterium]
MSRVLTRGEEYLKNNMNNELGFNVIFPDLKNIDGNTPLMLVNFLSNPLNYTKILIKMGANPNIQNSLEDSTALHYAVANENQETIRYLLSIGSNPFVKDIDGETPYDFAMRHDHIIEAHILKDYMIRKIQNKQLRRMTRKRAKTMRRLALAKSMESQQGPFSSIRYDPSLIEKITEFM